MSESSQPAHPVDKPGRLAELEKVIARQTYKQRGSALAEISNNQLYKPEFTNFDDYCVIRWGFQSKYGYRLIIAAEVAEELSPIGDIATESQARELAKVAKEKREAVLRAALLKAQLAGRKLSAKDIAAAANPQTSSGTAKPASVVKKLRDLFGKASADERTQFLGWVEMMDSEMERAMSLEPAKPDESAKPAEPAEAAEAARPAQPAEPAKPTEPAESAEPAEPTDEAQDQFECDSCGETFADDADAVIIYECGECGTFTSDESSSNQCPSCNKFAAKLYDCGCPSCSNGELVEVGGPS